MNIDEITTSLWRNRWTFLATFLGCLAVIVFITVSLPKSYKATATIYVGGKETRKAVALNSTFGEQLSRTYATLAGNPNVANQVSATLPDHPSGSNLLSHMSFVPVERTQLLQVTAEANSPQRAQVLANTYANVFAARIAKQFKLGTTQATVEVNEPATLPTAPFKPKRSLYIGLGGLLSLLLAFGVVLLRERMDRRIKIGEDDDTILGHPVLGRIPRIPPFVGDAAPEVGDAFRLLKTTIDFADKEASKMVMITSPAPTEGKTRVSADLAIAAASDGEDVVVVEADVRRPGIRTTPLGRSIEPARTGLTNYLVGDASEDEIVSEHPKYPGLVVIWSGPTPANPSGLLRSERMTTLLSFLASSFDRVIVDTPPMLVGADASNIGGKVKAALCVVDAQTTTRSQAQAALHQLEKVPASLLGVVLNNVETRTLHGYYPPTGSEPLSILSEGQSRSRPTRRQSSSGQ